MERQRSHHQKVSLDIQQQEDYSNSKNNILHKNREDAHPPYFCVISTTDAYTLKSFVGFVSGLK